MSGSAYPIRCRVRAAGGGATRVDVYDDIGGGDPFDGGGLSAADFASQLATVKGPLDVHINSGGGDVFEGVAIHEAIRSHHGTVRTVVDGMAASIASVIAQAGQERVMSPGSMMMIHEAHCAGAGNAADLNRRAATLDKISDNIAGIYAGRSGQGDAASWREAMRAETWYTAEEAVDAGLADRISGDEARFTSRLDFGALAATAPPRIAARLHAAEQRATLTADDVRTIVREELHFSNASYDDTPWDGNAAMSACTSASDYRSICAGEHSAGSADERQHWALPHHKRPGALPNRAGTNNALSRLPQTQGLTNRSAAESHLQAHARLWASDSGSSNQHDQHDDEAPAWGFTDEEFDNIRAALKEAQ